MTWIDVFITMSFVSSFYGGTARRYGDDNSAAQTVVPSIDLTQDIARRNAELTSRLQDELKNRKNDNIYKLNKLFVLNFPFFSKNPLYPHLLLDSNFSISLYVYPNNCKFIAENGTKIVGNSAVDSVVTAADFCFRTWFATNESMTNDVRYDSPGATDQRFTLLFSCEPIDRRNTLAYFVPPTRETYPRIVYNSKRVFPLDPNLRETTCHEIGHYLGMDHVSEDSIMLATKRDSLFSDYDRQNIVSMLLFFRRIFEKRMNEILKIGKKLHLILSPLLGSPPRLSSTREHRRFSGSMVDTDSANGPDVRQYAHHRTETYAH